MMEPIGGDQRWFAGGETVMEPIGGNHCWFAGILYRRDLEWQYMVEGVDGQVDEERRRGYHRKSDGVLASMESFLLVRLARFDHSKPQ